MTLEETRTESANAYNNCRLLRVGFENSAYFIFTPFISCISPSLDHCILYLYGGQSVILDRSDGRLYLFIYLLDGFLFSIHRAITAACMTLDALMIFSFLSPGFFFYFYH